MDSTVDKDDQGSRLQREVEVGCGYWYLDLCLVVDPVALDDICRVELRFAYCSDTRPKLLAETTAADLNGSGSMIVLSNTGHD